jgi:6-phosphofructokinase 1
LATHFGVHAAELAEQKRWGRMINLRGTHFGDVAIAEAVSRLRRVDPEGEDVRVARAVGTSFGD